MTSVRAATAMAALAAMDEAGIGYAVVRNHEEIPVEPGRDIDLLADMSRRTGIERILEACKEEFGWESLVRCEGHHEGTSYYFIGPRRASGRPDQLEMHFTRIRWAGATILSPADVIARRIHAPSGIWVAAPEHTVAQRVIQLALSAGLQTMKEAYWAELQTLAHLHSEAVTRALAEVIGDEKLVASMVAALQAGDREGLIAVSRSLKRRFLLSRGGRDRLRNLPDMVWFAARRVLSSRWPARCGVVARFDPPTSDDELEKLEAAVSHMFLECRILDLARIGQPRFMHEAAEVVSRAGIVIVRAPDPFDASFRWVPSVTCWVPPEAADAGVDLIVRRFVANHRSVG